MLNIPETLIIHHEDLLRGSRSNAFSGSFKAANDSSVGSFLYLKNAQVIPSQGNLPSLPLVQSLTVEEHSRIHE